MAKRKMHPVWFLIIAIIFLIVPGVIYLAFLVPRLKNEYIILMTSGGVIGGGGMFGASLIPDKTRWGALFKTASRSFTLLVVVTLVREFIGQLLGLAVVLIVSYILFIIFRELWRNGKRARENADLAGEIARNIAENTK